MPQSRPWLGPARGEWSEASTANANSVNSLTPAQIAAGIAQLEAFANEPEPMDFTSFAPKFDLVTA